MKKSVLDLRPTQMALGMKEVDYRVKKINNMKDKVLEDYLQERRVPIILGPKARVYLVDHHHLARSCWEVGVKEIPVEVKADLSHLSYEELWKVMQTSHWIYPFDQLGGGPHDPINLPENIKGLADDPYRSLSWMVREKGGYEKSEKPFSEFHWANFFRKNMRLHPVFDHLDTALDEALRLAKSEKAQHLPGCLK